MPDAWLRKLLLAAVTSVMMAALVRALRGDPAPQFAGHGTGGNPGDRPMLVPVPTDPTVAAERPADTAELTRAVLAPVADVAPDDPAHGLTLVPASDVTAAATTEPGAMWADPVDGDCPPGFPVKAKLSSGIFHMPGGMSYDRTNPDRCYRSVDAAEADGLRAAKR